MIIFVCEIVLTCKNTDHKGLTGSKSALEIYVRQHH